MGGGRGWGGDGLWGRLLSHRLHRAIAWDWESQKIVEGFFLGEVSFVRPQNKLAELIFVYDFSDWLEVVWQRSCPVM